MNATILIFSFVSLMIAGASALFARNTWRTARTAIAQQTLVSFLREYRSAEMMDAVRALWDLYRQNPGNSMVERYKEIRARDEASWRAATPLEQVPLIANTLDYKRRLVTHFYVYLAQLAKQKILPKEIIYASWTKAALEIIPKVIIPLERGLDEVLGDTGDLGVLPGLQWLYDMAPDANRLKPKCGS